MPPRAEAVAMSSAQGSEQQRQQAVQQCLGYSFTNTELLTQACTHASYCDANASAAERLGSHNERMEFLGDGLLGAAIGELVFQRYTHAAEGELSQLRSSLVSRRTLARAMDLHQLISKAGILAKVPEPWPDSVKANIAEAILGAIYLDGGWDALRAAVKNLLNAFFTDPEQSLALGDAKNRLQIWALKQHKKLPQYIAQRDGGSDHEPRFTCTVSIAQHSAQASGSSKRRSEAHAALALLKLVGEEQ